METRIVTLTPTEVKLSTEPYDFEDAFGEYEWSEARGRGRARRAKRRADRIAKRRERRMARIQARDEVRSARKEARIRRRADAQRMRQEKRRQAMERRQEKKFARKEMKMKRKELGEDEPGAEMDDATQDEMMDREETGYTPRTLPPDSEESGEDTGSYGGGGGYSGGGESGSTIYAEDEYVPTMDYTDEQYSEQDPAYNEEEYEGDLVEGDFGGGEGDDVYSEDESGFSGEIDTDKVDPKLLGLAKKIEWNKELVLRLGLKKLEIAKRLSMTPVGARTEKLKKEIADCDNQIAMRKARITELENMFVASSNFSGSNREKAKARRVARKMRARVSAVNRGKGRKLGLRKKLAMENGGDVTPVDSDLNPDIKTNYIRIPGRMGMGMGASDKKSNMTGIIALDDPNAYDADEPRIVEITSNAEGDTTKGGINLKNVLIVGLTGLALYYLVKSMTKKD